MATVLGTPGYGSWIKYTWFWSWPSKMAGVSDTPGVLSHLGTPKQFAIQGTEPACSLSGFACVFTFAMGFSQTNTLQLFRLCEVYSLMRCQRSARLTGTRARRTKLWSCPWSGAMRTRRLDSWEQKMERTAWQWHSQGQSGGCIWLAMWSACVVHHIGKPSSTCCKNGILLRWATGSRKFARVIRKSTIQLKKQRMWA